MMHLQWPTKEGWISSQFGLRIDPIKRGPDGSKIQLFHTGMDIAVVRETGIAPVYKGTLTIAGWWNGYGNVAVVHHFSLGNVWSLYAHLTGVLVSPGSLVVPGQTFCLSGSSGNSTGPHLHFEVRVGLNRIFMARNPMRYLPPPVEREGKLWVPA